MGRKKKSSVAKEPAYVQDDNEDAVALAEQLLAEMGLDSGEPSTETPSTGAIAHSDTEANQAAGADSGSKTSAENSSEVSAAPEEARKPRRNRRKEKLAEREKKYQELADQVRAELADTPDAREVEMLAMDKQTKEYNLSTYDIVPDGHCLFASIADQLEQHNGQKYTVPELRALAADIIKKNADDFIPYMLDENTGELRDVDEYTNAVKNTTLWGGEVEIQALSRGLKSPIRVFFGTSSPMTVNEDLPGNLLNLAYYKQIYGLGAHYNSLRNAAENTETA